MYVFIYILLTHNVTVWLCKQIYALRHILIVSFSVVTAATHTVFSV